MWRGFPFFIGWLVLMGDWNAILDPKIDKVGAGELVGWESMKAA